MIPLRDSVRSRAFPVVNVALIAVNVAVFLRELSMGQGRLEAVLSTYAVDPARIADAMGRLSGSPGALLPVAVTLVTASFLHGGWLHLGGNMLYLWIFGDNVEDRLGHFRYLLLYLLAGAIGFLAHGLLAAPTHTPTIGASGSIAGVLGAYFVTFPRARVVTLIALGIFFQFIEVPAFVFLVIWLLMQLISGVAALGAAGTADTVAWWAHVGGFASGAILMWLLRPRPRRRAAGRP